MHYSSSESKRRRTPARARAPPAPDGMVATANATSPALRTTTASPAPGRRTGRRPTARTGRPRRTSLRASSQPLCCRRGCEAACLPRIPSDPVQTICPSPRRPWFACAPASPSAPPLPPFPQIRRLRQSPHPLPDPVPVHADRELPAHRSRLRVARRRLDTLVPRDRGGELPYRRRRWPLRRGAQRLLRADGHSSHARTRESVPYTAPRRETGGALPSTHVSTRSPATIPWRAPLTSSMVRCTVHPLTDFPSWRASPPAPCHPSSRRRLSNRRPSCPFPSSIPPCRRILLRQSRIGIEPAPRLGNQGAGGATPRIAGRSAPCHPPNRNPARRRGRHAVRTAELARVGLSRE